jgi:PmbA protein
VHSAAAVADNAAPDRASRQDITLSDAILTTDDSAARLEALADLSRRLLERCLARGASQAEVSCSEERGLNVNVRMGAVETVEATRDRGIGVTVYFGRRKGSASTADLREASLDATVEQACAIARHTEDDDAAGLADAGRMALPDANGRWPDFDSWHPWALDADRAVDIALACEAAGRDADPRIGNSDGASVGSGESLSVYANTHGFVGAERGTQHSIGCALIAGEGDRMQRDGWYTSALAETDLESPAAVGRHAARRTLARLDPRPLATGEYPVLFSAEVARSLVGHLLGAVSGGALYRRASFLLDSAGQKLFPDWFSIVEKPWLRRGLRSAAFDAEGVATRESPLVEAGVLRRYVLGSYSARKLGLESTGNAGGVHNLEVGANAGGFAELLAGMGRGLVVTELMGQGVNAVTGDYSRGAAGYWIEGGEPAHPVDGITIAGNLRAMFAGIEAVASDVDPRSHIRTGSILVGRMTVAGGD